MNIKLIAPTVKMIARSQMIRNFAVQTITLASVAELIGELDPNEDELKDYVRAVVLIGCGFALSYALNRLLDTVLEKHDEQVFIQYNEETKGM